MNPNPYRNTTKAVPFAAEVYREEAAPAAKPALESAVASLRAELRGEARALRSAIAKPRVPAELTAEIASLRASVDELLAVEAPKRGGDGIAAILRARAVEGTAASALARAAKGSKDKDASPSDRLHAAAESAMKVTSWGVALEGKSLIAVVGPAGVGKTTTAAKLAARARMAKKTVALVSCDGFRVGAIDQLGKYAELMDVRFHVATNQEELLEIVKNETADVVIVDTSGRAVEPNATEAALGSPELRTGPKARNCHVMLCVPANLRANDTARVVRQFAATAPNAVAVTKVDETDAPSGIAHIAYATKLPISTVCFGQRVPEDIGQATAAGLADYLFPTDGADAEQ